MSDLTPLPIAPMGENWLKRAQRKIEQKSREQNVSGVQYFADEYDLIPGRTLADHERFREACDLYGPPEHPVIDGQPR